MLLSICYIAVMRLILLLSLLSLQCYFRQGESESIIIIALPQSDTKVSTSWERGNEILPGALAAAKEANFNNDSLLFSLRVANSGRYDLHYSGNVLEIIANLTWQNRVSDIIGIVGLVQPSILVTLKRFQLPIVSLLHFNEIPDNFNINYMTASTSTLTDSILASLTEIHPKKIGIITEIEQPYYLMISNELRTKTNTSLCNIQIVHKHHKIFSGIADRVFASNVHVILLSVSPSTAIPMLCEAYKSGLKWPKYAWILHSYRLDDLLRRSKSNERCSVWKILEGIFIFQLTKEKSNFDSETVHRNIRNNPYANLLYDSVWSLISSVDNKSFSHFNEVSSPFHFSPDVSKVYIYHNMNGMASLISIYDGASHTLKLTSEITFADSDLPVVPHVFAPYLLSLPLLCLLFNTILLVLYIYFRNERSIKSTSVSLSMLIFTGCYFLVGFTVGLILNRQYRFDFCMVNVWLSGLGLSIPLILATILVKMLRVYHIFTSFKRLKQTAKCKDCALLIYTLLILSPNIIIVTLWTAIDPYHKVGNFIEHPAAGFIRVEWSCHSDYVFIWITLGISYFFLLSAAVIIVAVKSRKIRRAQFKDTKKVNLFIFLLVIICPGSLLYSQFFYSFWFIFFVNYVVHILAAFLCQIILFVPKIWPSIQTFKAQESLGNL